MALESSLDTLKLRLEHINTAAQKIKSSAHLALCKAGREPPARNTASTPAMPNLFLPIPEGIMQLLVDTGCPFGAARPLSDAFIRSAHKLRDMYQTTHRQTCQRMAKNPCSDPTSLIAQFNKLGSSLEAQYRQRIIAAQQLAVEKVQKIAPSKPVFNQEFVPLLEKYFEYNAYPSAPDRVALARKSMMTPRQIEVWFQNHRNRAKKEGKTLRKLTSDPLPLQLSLESLEKKMPFFVIPEHERKHIAEPSVDSPDDSEEDEFELASEPHTKITFSVTAPPHAYPMTYPPSCNYDPFPCKTTKHTLRSPVWMRKPATTLPHRSPVVFEDFVSAFAAKLAFRESSKMQHSQHRKAPPVHKPTCRWFEATRTTTPPAPHPALIRLSAFVHVTKAANLLPTVSAPSSRLHPFRSLSPTSQHITLVPDTLSDNLTRREVAKLPKRVPKHASMALRSGSPGASEASLSPSPSFRTLSSSRTPSFSSDASSDRRLSSSSDSLSSSAPTTPGTFPTQLPTKDMSVSKSGLDLENEDLFNFSDPFSHLQPDLHAEK